MKTQSFPLHVALQIFKSKKKIYNAILSVTVLLWAFIGTLHAQPRTEKDLLGEKQIPNSAYYGVQTARALENFQISGVTTKFYPDYVRAYAMVKLAAAQANTDIGRMSKDKLAMIEKACR